jgi:hypothetical protein
MDKNPWLERVLLVVLTIAAIGIAVVSAYGIKQVLGVIDKIERSKELY